MSDPARNKPNPDDPAGSGARRRIDDDVAPETEPLPPPPAVLTSRPKILTGRYAILVPREAEPVEPSEKK